MSMFGRKKNIKEDQTGRGRISQDAAVSNPQDGGGKVIQGAHKDLHMTASAGSTPSTTSTPRGVSAEEYRRLRELLESKCDEVDDLGNNLKLAKESLRHLSERLDRTNEELDKTKEDNSNLQKENKDLRRSLSSVQSMAEDKLELAAKLEEGLRKFQAELELKEAQLQNERQRLQQQLLDNATELQRRELRIHRLTTNMDDMEEGIAVGRVHVKKLAGLLSLKVTK